MSFIVKSKRKKPTLLFDTFRYIQDKAVKTTIYWKCEHCSCPGRFKQYGSNLPLVKNIHNHNGDEYRCQVEEFKASLKRRIEHSSRAVKRIYREGLISLETTSPQVTPFTPSYPAAPQTINNVKIEGIWRKTLNSDPFVLLDEKHPIFGTTESPQQPSAYQKVQRIFVIAWYFKLMSYE
ncbi:unnamed protein product [Rotaria sp. Silwood2]|nr:unnamed protein product [Rotaria sp. Silwood2]CAF3163660.1 unnamed protein product [Rotaria sp. Silwood2]CAF3361719.1 unnamed protein product [Rotaria sp. Silwood2]CAF3468061.1 unnamed protein product [Rotaria sp. Silwood2]CAF4505097.1 unnamed protein product [Rotaria sp. Silwood2]